MGKQTKLPKPANFMSAFLLKPYAGPIIIVFVVIGLLLFVAFPKMRILLGIAYGSFLLLAAYGTHGELFKALNKD